MTYIDSLDKYSERFLDQPSETTTYRLSQGRHANKHGR